MSSPTKRKIANVPVQADIEYREYMKLYREVEELNVEEVRRLLEQGVDPDYNNGVNARIIHLLIHLLKNTRERGAYQKLIQIFHMCMNSGLSISDEQVIMFVNHIELLRGVAEIMETDLAGIEGPYHTNLLHVVERPECAQYLIEKGVDVNAVGSKSIIPAEHGRREPVTPLLINLQRLLVNLAQKKEYQSLLEIIGILLDAGADLLYSFDGHSCLEYLILVPFEDTSIVKNLLKRSTLYLHDSIESDDPEVLERAKALTALYVKFFTTRYAFPKPDNARNNSVAHLPDEFYDTSLFGMKIHPTQPVGQLTDEKIEKIRAMILDLLPHQEDFIAANNVEETRPHFYFHNHKLSEGVTRQAIEWKLNEAGTSNQEFIHCIFYTPDNRRDKGCTGVYDRRVLSAVVSKEAWEKFDLSAKERERRRLIKEEQAKRELTGLNVQMPIYNTILQSNQEHVSYNSSIGYNWTMCAFCLQPMERGTGCNYMGHAKPSPDTPENLHPWCNPKFFVKLLWDNYIKIGRFASEKYLDTPPSPELDHLETCIECGGPCFRHHHFNYTRPGAILFTNNDPNYTQCPGGGRIELISRILAVRKVYQSGKYTKPMEERIAAATYANTIAIQVNYVLKQRKWLIVAIKKANLNNRKNNAQRIHDAHIAIDDAKETSKAEAPLWYRVSEARFEIRTLTDQARRANSGLSAATLDSFLEDATRDEKILLRRAMEEEEYCPPWWFNDACDPNNKIWHPAVGEEYPMELTEMDKVFLNGYEYASQASDMLNQPRNTRKWPNNVPAERHYDDYAYELYHQQKALAKTEIVQPPITNAMIEADHAHVELHEQEEPNNMPPLERIPGGKRSSKKRMTLRKKRVMRKNHGARKTIHKKRN